MAAGDLTDLATVKAVSDLGTTSSDTDGILGLLITDLSAYVPQVIGREILAADFVEIYDGNGKAALMLRQRPIISIASIAFEDGQTLSQAGSFSSSGIWTDGRNARLNGYVFPSGSQIQISYRAGYVAVPGDVSLAVAELVAEAYARRPRVGESSRSQGGQETISFDLREMHPIIKSKLASYMIGAPC